jgi:mannose-6-phosphate isomerase
MPWGGDRLQTVLRKPGPTVGPIGESWEISDHHLHESVVAEGPRQGRSLRNLMEDERLEVLGPASSRYSRFPWLLKFLDARDWLSVQVHPNDDQAARLSPNEGGKTETWFILKADTGSRVYAGLKRGVGEKELRAALARGNVVDCLYAFEPQSGDCVFLPAGTVHAVGGGVLMAELQQNSDATFRLFDWDRRDAAGKARPLHIEESLACIDWNRTEVQPQHVAEYAAVVAGAKTVDGIHQLVNCPYFATEFRVQQHPFQLGGSGKMQVVQVLSGRGKLGQFQLELGQSWLLPADLPRQCCVPHATLSLLIASLP